MRGGKLQTGCGSSLASPVSTEPVGLAWLKRAGQTCKVANQVIVALNIDVKKAAVAIPSLFLLYAALRHEDLTART